MPVTARPVQPNHRVGLAWAALAAALAAASAARADEGALTSGQVVEGTLPHGRAPWRSFVLDVPLGARRLEVTLEATGDADLFLRAGRPIDRDWKQEATAQSATPGGRERVVLTAGGSPPLEAGRYWVDVVHAAGRRGAPLTFKLVATLGLEGEGPGATPMAPSPESPADLGAGGARRVAGDGRFEVDLPADGPNHATFRLEVGADVTALHLTATAADGADVDLYARFGAPMDDWSQAEHRADGPGGAERLVIARAGGAGPPLRTGVYWVDVARAGDGPVRARLEVRLARGEAGGGGAAPAGETAPPPPEPSDEPGVAREVRRDAREAVTLPARGDRWVTWRVHVPEGARSLLVTTRGAGADVDVFLRHGQAIEDYQRDPDHRADSERRDETLWVGRRSRPPLRPGVYWLDIVRAVDEGVGPFEVTVRFDAERPPPQPASASPLQPLRLGERVEVEIDRAERKAARFRFEVPAGARRLHVAVLRATRDVDLFLRRGGPVTDYDDDEGSDWRAKTPRLNERLTVDGASSPPLRPGAYELDVASLVSSDARVRLALVVTLDDPPVLLPEDLRLPPFPLPADATPLERALRATVQVESESGSGSGTCLSPRGLVVTNYHVLEDEGELRREGIFVSFPDALDEPPAQVLLMRVAFADQALDLALLEPVSDALDRRLPADLRLPFLRLGGALRLGEELTVAGYPSVGGDESRSSVTVTRGVVSGFQREGDRRVWVKTDARINAGNSGGSGLRRGPDGAFELVAVPTRELIEDDDEIGYCRPVGVLPPAWLERIRAEGGGP